MLYEVITPLRRSARAADAAAAAHRGADQPALTPLTPIDRRPGDVLATLGVRGAGRICRRTADGRRP